MLLIQAIAGHAHQPRGYMRYQAMYMLCLTGTVQELCYIGRVPIQAGLAMMTLSAVMLHHAISLLLLSLPYLLRTMMSYGVIGHMCHMCHRRSYTAPAHPACYCTVLATLMNHGVEQAIYI